VHLQHQQYRQHAPRVVREKREKKERACNTMDSVSEREGEREGACRQHRQGVRKGVWRHVASRGWVDGVAHASSSTDHSRKSGWQLSGDSDSHTRSSSGIQLTAK
jgi:hypothetical protein